MCNEIYIIVFMCSPDIAHYCHPYHMENISFNSTLSFSYQCHKKDLLLMILA